MRSIALSALIVALCVVTIRADKIDARLATVRKAFVEPVDELGDDRLVAVCLAESETIQTPPVQTADFFYLRLRKDEYSAKSLREHVQKIADLGRRGEVFAYFKHEETPQGASRAEAMLAAMSAS